jgi:hypothetical protein
MTTVAEKKCRGAGPVLAIAALLNAVLIFAMPAPAGAQPITIGTADYRTYDYLPSLAGSPPGALHVGPPLGGGSEVVYHVTRGFCKTNRSVIDPVTGVATFQSQTDEPTGRPAE